MLSIPSGFARLCNMLLEQKDVAMKQRSHYTKWLRYTLHLHNRRFFERLKPECQQQIEFLLMSGRGLGQTV
jgi:hypothetical protein